MTDPRKAYYVGQFERAMFLVSVRVFPHRMKHDRDFVPLVADWVWISIACAPKIQGGPLVDRLIDHMGLDCMEA